MSAYVNINSITDSYNAWKNYYYGDNTQKISAKIIGAIEEKWVSELGKWKIRAESTDENEYEIEDDVTDSAKKSGRKEAKDAAGGVSSNNWKGAKDSASYLAGGIGSTYFAGKMVKQTGGLKSLAKSTDQIKNSKNILKGYTETQKEGSGTAVGKKTAKFSAYVAATIAIATVAKYYIEKPNKEEVEACQDLVDTLGESQDNLETAQKEMDEASASVAEWTEEANDTREDANEQLKEQKSQFDMYKNSLLSLKDKVSSGAKLTDSEKELYSQLVPALEEVGTTINDISEDSIDKVGELYSDIENQQDVFDETATTVAEVEGITDYAQDLDRGTRTALTLTGAGMTLNSASAFAAGTKLLASSGLLNIANIILGSAAIVAGGASGIAAKEQLFDHMGKVNQEVDIRKMTQKLDTSVSESYDDQIDIYSDNIEIVEDLEIDVPDDIEVPEDMTVPDECAPDTGSTENQLNVAPEAYNSNLFSFNTEEDDNKKGEEDKKPKV